MTNEQPRRLSDARAAMGDGAEPTEPYLGQDLTIHAYEEVPSMFDNTKTYLIITADTNDGQSHRIRCSSAMVRRRLIENKDLMPYIAQIVKRGQSYNLE